MQTQRRYGLSKSKITAFEQCARRLWLQTRRPELACFDDGAEARFAAGNAVGEMARTLVHGGVLVDEDDLGAALSRTRRLLTEAPRPLFEATFEHDGVLVRADVVAPDGTGGWQVAEVKSSTAAKDHHAADLATQVWVMEACGLVISSAAIRHLDRTFVLREPGNYRDLFTDADLTAAIRPIVAGRPNVVHEARIVLAGEEPVCEVGEQCHSPYECEFRQWCGRDMPEPPEWPIGLLPRTGGKLAAQWAERGIFDLRDLPPDAGLNDLHERIRRATVSGEPFIDRRAVASATASWAHPRIWIDFETIAFAVPRWVGTSPWQPVPFQFSAHVEWADGRVDHVEALDIGGEDPRAFIAQRLTMLPTGGTVVAWNAGFERRCFRELAAACPAHADVLLDLERRTEDLLPIVRSHYYDREQRGRWSIKVVLPTLAREWDHAGLEIKNGRSAQEAYRQAVAPGCSPELRSAIDLDLRAYCRRDSWAMLLIHRRLLGEAVPDAP